MLPRPSSDWRWACDLSLSDAAGCLLLAKWGRRLRLNKPPSLSRVFAFWVRMISAVFRDAPLQQDFVFNEQVHLLLCSPLAFSLKTLKARCCIEISGGDQWIVDDSASIILMFQDKYSEITLSLWPFLFDYALTFMFPSQTAQFDCNCSKKRVSLKAKSIFHSQTVDASLLLRDSHSCNSNI